MEFNGEKKTVHKSDFNKNFKKSYHLGVCPFWPIFYPFISETTRARSNRVEKMQAGHFYYKNNYKNQT